MSTFDQTQSWISPTYLLAEELWQNTGSFEFDIFKLRDLLWYIPLQSKGKSQAATFNSSLLSVADKQRRLQLLQRKDESSGCLIIYLKTATTSTFQLQHKRVTSTSRSRPESGSWPFSLPPAYTRPLLRRIPALSWTESPSPLSPGGWGPARCSWCGGREPSPAEDASELQFSAEV